jgi:hypothetical protein
VPYGVMVPKRGGEPADAGAGQRHAHRVLDAAGWSRAGWRSARRPAWPRHSRPRQARRSASSTCGRSNRSC